MHAEEGWGIIKTNKPGAIIGEHQYGENIIYFPIASETNFYEIPSLIYRSEKSRRRALLSAFYRRRIFLRRYVEIKYP